MSAILHSLDGAFSDGRILSEKLAMRQNAFSIRKAQGSRSLAVCGLQLPVSVYIEVYGRGKCKPDKLRKIRLEGSRKGQKAKQILPGHWKMTAVCILAVKIFLK